MPGNVAHFTLALTFLSMNMFKNEVTDRYPVLHIVAMPDLLHVARSHLGIL